MLAAMSVLPSDVRTALAHLTKMGDRGPPMVFAGREPEFELFDSAIYGTRHGDLGRTVVIQGIPGAGKTTLLNEHSTRLSSLDSEGQPPVVPVPLRPSDLNAPPAAVVEEIDRQYRTIVAGHGQGVGLDRAVDSTMFAAKALFASFTKRDFNEFRPSARAPASLPIALDEYVSFRVGRRGSTIMLLVDEAQNLADTEQVRSHLDALHGGIRGHTNVLLACFGLADTEDRLRTLGLSRLASGHVRTIGPMSNEAASKTVVATLDAALSGFAFDGDASDDVLRERWIGQAANAILHESANFPHHLANGCRGLAEIVLDEGVEDEPPLDALRRKCRQYRADYYNTRLRPWETHTIALALAFAVGDGGDGGNGGEVRATDLVRALMAADNRGLAVDQATATQVMDGLRDSGYIEEHMGSCRPAIPSLTSHFSTILNGLRPDNEAAHRVRDALHMPG